MALNIAVPLSGVGGLSPISPISISCWENIKMFVSPSNISESSGVSSGESNSSLDSDETKTQQQCHQRNDIKQENEPEEQTSQIKSNDNDNELLIDLSEEDKDSTSDLMLLTSSTITTTTTINNNNNNNNNLSPKIIDMNHDENDNLINLNNNENDIISKNDTTINDTINNYNNLNDIQNININNNDKIIINNNTEKINNNKDLKIIYNGRDILDLGKNLELNNKLWNLRYTYLPEQNNVKMFLLNRSQYHRLGKNGHIQEYTLNKCDKCDFQYPINFPNNYYFCKTSLNYTFEQINNKNALYSFCNNSKQTNVTNTIINNQSITSIGINLSTNNNLKSSTSSSTTSSQNYNNQNQKNDITASSLYKLSSKIIDDDIKPIIKQKKNIKIDENQMKEQLLNCDFSVVLNKFLIKQQEEQNQQQQFQNMLQFNNNNNNNNNIGANNNIPPPNINKTVASNNMPLIQSNPNNIIGSGMPSMARLSPQQQQQFKNYQNNFPMNNYQKPNTQQQLLNSPSPSSSGYCSSSSNNSTNYSKYQNYNNNNNGINLNNINNNIITKNKQQQMPLFHKNLSGIGNQQQQQNNSSSIFHNTQDNISFNNNNNLNQNQNFYSFLNSFNQGVIQQQSNVGPQQSNIGPQQSNIGQQRQQQQKYAKMYKYF